MRLKFRYLLNIVLVAVFKKLTFVKKNMNLIILYNCQLILVNNKHQLYKLVFNRYKSTIP